MSITEKMRKTEVATKELLSAFTNRTNWQQNNKDTEKSMLEMLITIAYSRFAGEKVTKKIFEELPANLNLREINVRVIEYKRKNQDNEIKIKKEAKSVYQITSNEDRRSRGDDRGARHDSRRHQSDDRWRRDAKRKEVGRPPWRPSRPTRGQSSPPGASKDKYYKTCFFCKKKHNFALFCEAKFCSACKKQGHSINSCRSFRGTGSQFNQNQN